MEEPGWLCEAELRAWQGFLGAGALLERCLDQQLREDAGLSHAQYEIMARLSAAPDGELRMTELADALYNSKSGLTYKITQMESAGLVSRRACPSDVRGIFATLTDAGRKRLEEATPGHVALVRELVMDVLTPDQIAALAEGFAEVSRRIVDREN
ncbi:MarR family winged helix-turn-helix transcriptional regulator [Streptomyces tubercidicus]|uniref:MarR family winged helix-turn-helix transcriptional regulator n=1 Tax=Streptomyces tubercidicus TaxID=47759 RepID=UPI003464F139